MAIERETGASDEDIGGLRDDTCRLVDQLHAIGAPQAADAIQIAVEAFEEALLRLRAPLPGKPDDT